MTRLSIAFATLLVCLPVGLSTVRAQVARSFDFASGEMDRVAEARIDAALAGRMNFDFSDVPLKRFVELLNQQGIPAQVDHRALDDYGLDDDAPIRLQQANITMRSALDLILKQLDLAWTIRNEVLLITTDEEVEGMMKTRVYDVSELVPSKAMIDNWGRAVTGRDFDSLVDLIQSTIEPQTWDVVGGPASIATIELPHSGVLVISQTLAVHEQIARLLAGLHQIDQQHNRAVPSRTPRIRRSSGIPRAGIESGSTVPRNSLPRSYLPRYGMY